MSWKIERNGCGEATLINDSNAEIKLSAEWGTSAEHFTVLLTSLETYLDTGKKISVPSEDEAIGHLTSMGIIVKENQ